MARIGFATADPFPEVAGDLLDRRKRGLAGRLGFTFNDPVVATTPRVSFPWAQSLVVGAFPYQPARARDPSPGTGRVSAAARSPGYEPLRRALSRVETAIVEAGHRAEVLVDDNRLVDRAAGIRAGIGWWGKNTMILAPRIGPWFLLGSVITDAEFDPDPPMSRDCGSCSACIPACPTGALIAPGILDASRCLAAWAQTPGLIPVEFRVAMGDRIYGCDDCIEACPPGSRVEASPEGIRFPLGSVLAVSDQTLLDWFGHWFIPDRNPRIVRRNALIAAGNSRLEGMVAVVARYAGHPDWLLRAHAVWALGQLGGPLADSVIADRRVVETDPRVRSELSLLAKIKPPRID